MDFQGSPNFDARKGGDPDMLIIHYTGLPVIEASLKRLTDPGSKVSAHYLIGEDGRIIQLVPEEKRAWHAGESYWQGEEGLNDRSIGIELQNPGHEFGYRAFPEIQVDSLISLCRDIREHWNIPNDRVLGHSDVAPGRKQDPGELFPWSALAREGLGLWPRNISPGADSTVFETSHPDDIRELQEKLAAFGYRISPSGDFDFQTRTVLTAFQRHWRPATLSGVGDAETLAILDNLLERRGLL